LPASEVETAKSDPWSHFLPLLFDELVVVVASAGNQGMSDTIENTAAHSPRRYAMMGQIGEGKLIIAGAADSGDQAATWANNFRSIITVYAPGDRVHCATFNSNTAFRIHRGTSIAAALTSGTISTYLTRPDLQEHLSHPQGFHAAVIALVKEAAAFAYDGGVTLGLEPILSTYNFLPCNPRWPVGQEPPLSPEEDSLYGERIRSITGVILRTHSLGVSSPILPIRISSRGWMGRLTD
jgi:hypothetical protein